MSALLPARAGDAFRVAALRLPPVGQPRIPIADSLGSIILERTLDIVALLLLSASIGALLLGGGFPRWLTTFYVGGLALVVLGLGLLIGIPSLLERLQGWIHHRWWQVGLELLGRISVSLRALPRHPLLMTGVLLESFYIWLCDAVLLWLVIWSLDQPIPFPDAAFVALTADVFAAVPLTPGGVGQIESAYALLLSLLPSAPFNIPAAILATRAISYWSFLLVSGMIIIATGMGRLIFRQASVMGGTAGQVEPTQQRERADG